VPGLPTLFSGPYRRRRNIHLPESVMTEHSDPRRRHDDRGGRRAHPVRLGRLSTSIVLGCLLVSLSACCDKCCDPPPCDSCCQDCPPSQVRTYEVGPNLSDKNWPWKGDTLVFRSPALDRFLCIRPGTAFAKPGESSGLEEYRINADEELELVVQESAVDYMFMLVETTAWTDCKQFFEGHPGTAKTPDGGQTGP